MPATAVVICGVPGKALIRAYERLSADFAQGYVFRGRPTKFNDRHSVQFTARVIDDAITDATDAVFGKTARPLSFCRKPAQSCARRIEGKTRGNRTCGLLSGQSCSLERPERLLVFYQEGRDEPSLLRTFYHSALTRRIPATVYGDAEGTFEVVANGIRDSRALFDAIEREFTTRRSPLLLPPKGFRTDGAVTKLLLEVNGGSDASARATEFRQAHWKQSDLAFESDQQLLFKAEELHGIAGPMNVPKFALSAHYRLGCAITPGFHWNVARADGRNLTRTLDCRANGPTAVNATHVNLFADDRLR